MIALFLSSSISLFLFICFGLFTSKILSLKSTAIENFFVGLIVVNTLTLVVSIFYPISHYILLGFIVAAFVLLFYIKKDVVKLYEKILSEYRILLFSIPFILIGLSISLQQPSVFDSGLYHIQSIKWIEEYATVPGLANLHHRFGFNPTIFNVYALTSLKCFFDQEIFSINFVLFSIFVIYFIHKLYYIFKQSGINNYFIFYSLFFYVLLLLSGTISSPAPDFLSSTLLLFIFLQLIDTYKKDTSPTLKTFMPLLICSTYCIMAKLSTLPIGLFILYVLFSYRQNTKQLIGIVIGLVLICIPWFIKTILLTGWVLYPFSAIDLFDFDWKVPTEMVQHLNAEIVGWARCPNDYYYEAAHLPMAKWVPLWWHSLTISIKLLIISSIVFPILLFFGQIFKIIPIKHHLNMILLTALLGVCFWFLTAPDFRFGQIFILIAVCSPLLYIHSDLSLFANTTHIKKELLFICICTILLFKFARNNYGLSTYTFHEIFISACVKPEKIHSKNAAYTYTYMGNNKIYKPTYDERCFDHELPCSFININTIELRGKGIQSGFKSKQHVNSVFHSK